jgi:GTP-binding protein
VPVGTVIHDVERDEVVGDLTRSGDQVLVARGGRGGVGNATRSAWLRVASPPPPRPAAGDRRPPRLSRGTGRGGGRLSRDLRRGPAARARR